MHNIHKGEKSDVSIRRGDGVNGETNGEIIARNGGRRRGGGGDGDSSEKLGHQVRSLRRGKHAQKWRT